MDDHQADYSYYCQTPETGLCIKHMLQANGKAPARAYHSTTLYRHELWVFGGVYPRPDPQPDGCSNDLHVFNPMDESWYEPIVNGTKPVPRSGQVVHGMASNCFTASIVSLISVVQRPKLKKGSI